MKITNNHGPTNDMEFCAATPQKISFCITVKNRLHHLKETLPRNLKDNGGYEQLQFVILDYNSSDGLSEWLRAGFYTEISNGKITYYRTEEPQYFHRSHSRNMAFKVAGGDIVCNLDADNFTGPDFAASINRSFSTGDNIFLTALAGIALKQDFMGRVCCRKSDFILSGGYDESMEGYGFEDYDFVNKLSALGIKKTAFEHPELFEAIAHSDQERIAEERLRKSLKGLYVCHRSSFESEILFLLQNATFYSGTLICNRSLHAREISYALSPPAPEYYYMLKHVHWDTGSYKETDISVVLQHAGSSKQLRYNKLSQNMDLKAGRKKFMHITEEATITTLTMFHSQFTNRTRMKSNETSSQKETGGTIGTGIVSKNFGKNLIAVL